MRFTVRFLIFLQAALLYVSCASPLRAADLPVSPPKYVVDLAGIVDDTVEYRLNGYLQELEQKTTAQFVVLTVKSLDGQSIEAYAIAVAHDRWKLGQKGKDNGLLMLISTGDRKYRIEVGYGLEGVLPDSLVGSIGRNIMVPAFRKGDYTTGIFNAAVTMTREIAADAGVQITGMPALQHRSVPHEKNRPRSLLSSIITLVILFIMVIFFLKNPRLFLLFLLSSSMGGRRGTWGGGGGFGSFGGGGGGGFGGGGASGGW